VFLLHPVYLLLYLVLKPVDACIELVEIGNIQAIVLFEGFFSHVVPLTLLPQFILGCRNRSENSVHLIFTDGTTVAAFWLFSPLRKLHIE
jgi:hypothetical protein